MIATSHRTLWNYALALGGFMLAAAALRLPLIAQGPGAGVLLAVAAVLLAARVGGLGPGLLVTALFAWLVWPQSFRPDVLLHLSLFVTCGCTISVLMESLHDARRRACDEERERRAHEAQYRQLVETAHDGFWALDAAGCTEYANPQMARMLGTTPEAMLGRSVFDFMDESVHAEAMAKLRRRRDGIAEQHDFRFRRADGSDLWASVSAGPVLDEAGHYRGAQAIVSDITERRRGEQQLRAERDFTAAVLETTGCLVVVLDREARIVRFNRASQEATGYSADEVLGRPFWELLPRPDEAEASRREFALLVAGGGPNDREGHVRTKEGGERLISWAQAALRDDAGTVRHVVATGIDITAERRAELAVAAREEHYRLLFEANPEPMWIYDTDTLEFLAVNGAAVARYGYSREEFLAMTIAGIRPDEDVATLRSRIDRVRGEGFLANSRWRHRTKDGRLLDVEVSSQPIAYQGRSARVVLAHDVSERRQAEAELLRAKNEADAANQAKDLFLAMLSHELRTPLTPALLAVSGLAEDPELPPALRPSLEAARQGILAEARLIDDLLDVTRIGQGKLRLRPERIDAREAVRLALAACEGELKDGEQHLEVDLATEATVQADPVRLQQVVWNLIKNAVKFTPAGGTIAVRTRVERACRCGGAACFLVEVSDTGDGIDAELLPRIFDAFEQGTGAGRRGGAGGLGLGLAIGRAIAEAHGGRLTAASDGPGRGSTFTLHLPVVEADRAAPSTPTPPGPPAAPARRDAPLRVLLVEDDHVTRRVLARLLQRGGSEVTTADSLAAAMHAAEAGSFDVVVSDVGLPDGSGLDLGTWLASRGRTPAIALTGYGADADVRRCVDAGFAAHLTKPVDFRRLEECIREVTSAP